MEAPEGPRRDTGSHRKGGWGLLTPLRKVTRLPRPGPGAPRQHLQLRLGLWQQGPGVGAGKTVRHLGVWGQHSPGTGVFRRLSSLWDRQVH